MMWEFLGSGGSEPCLSDVTDLS